MLSGRAVLTGAAENKFPFVEAGGGTWRYKRAHLQIKLTTSAKAAKAVGLTVIKKPWSSTGFAPSALFSKGALAGTYLPALEQAMPP